MKYLTFALAKGRLAKKSLALFEQIGISMDEMKDPDTRKLIFVNEDLKIKMFLAKDKVSATVEGIRCTDLCGIWCSRYRCGGQRYIVGRRTPFVRSAGSGIR